MIKKLKCHCGNVEAEVNIPDNGIEKIMRCNCSICKKKGYVIGVLGENDFKLTKGEDSLKLYQFDVHDYSLLVSFLDECLFQ